MQVFKWFLFGFLLFFVGCSSNQNAMQNNEINVKNGSHIIFDDKSLQKWLRLDDVNVVKRSDDLIEFDVTFTNTSSSNKLVSYKVIWKDENGFTQKTIMSKWTKTLVEEGRSLNIHGISPSVKSKDFEIMLQEPTDDDENRNDSYHKQYSH
ncbi:Predicted periplasmic lipoprotein [Campylobacter sputorum subsp. bubulus]|uniref:Predicted periplasmic lipoprotein n=1 Tax=Campylobacter sputorum subsp. sputorum TaxID=32024 RepID=A0A381DK52_9BACT|nr:YcfL family protein [Campylobacter sputorum]ASM34421.1 hypothetical lipoprotein (DUF1425 domain) [Campylobacter sputorum aubsp. sputorum RM3237]ASM37769.1 hypothetical lipoprotein (DUF1425 domain) [Campylobacter sputorum bv. paraureolyticus LMG 11764]KAB0582190.1 DUF1425 domain-containing protein [Campylobacter sputorum subsp. sputorum]MDY6119933.1 YcfL family protein [Campylobacter sputorum]QEL04612.1 DUF1425 domain-containing protein [Campylobacter sputorum subsp. sputorum]